MKGSGFFTEKYLIERRKRLRRRRIVRTVSIIVAVLILVALLLQGKVKEYLDKQNKIEDSKNTLTENTTSVGETMSYFTHTLNDGNKVIIRYTMSEGRIHYDSADFVEGTCWVDFSPDSSKVLINDAGTQTIYIYDKERQMKDFSLEEFDYAGTGKMLRSYYSTKPGFTWANNGRFLNDHIVVFTSQVSLAVKPYFIWAIDLNNGRKTLIEETRSDVELKILERNKDGIVIEGDGLTMLITGDLKVQGVTE